MPNNETVEKQLAILDNDIARKALDTRTNYHYLARKFLLESGDLSRQGMMRWMNDTELSENSLRTAYYALERLCKALEVKFPLDKDDLPAIPDEETLSTPTMTAEDIRQLIQFWKMYPKSYETSLVFISTILGTRSCEMSTTQGLVVAHGSVIVNVAKRKAKVVREHRIPEQYLKYIGNYYDLSENSVRDKFRKCLRHSGIHIEKDMNWHSIRRGLATTFKLMGIEKELYKRFIRWAPNREDMASVYTHMPFEQVNNMMLGQIPNPVTGKTVEHPFLKEWD